VKLAEILTRYGRGLKPVA